MGMGRNGTKKAETHLRALRVEIIITSNDDIVSHPEPCT